jgi:hypothetical protein
VFFAPFLGLAELPFFMDCKNAEKPEIPNARSVRVWTELATVRFWEAKIQYLYGILRKSGHGMEYP